MPTVDYGETKELTPQEILEAIVSGKRVKFTLGFKPSVEYEVNVDQFNKLIAHLHVLKHREKKLYHALGLNKENVLIKADINMVDGIGEWYYDIYTVRGEPERKKHRCQIVG